MDPDYELEADIINRLIPQLGMQDHLAEVDLSNHHWMTTPLGFSTRGDLVTKDIGLMPHLLVAGTTGSGKSVFVTSVIAWMHLRSLCFGSMILIDPKCVEFSIFEGSPFVHSIINDPLESLDTINRLAVVMDKRFARLKEMGARDARSVDMDPVLVVIDEWADLVLQHRKIEIPLIRLAQKGRASGIHLILATQRPTRDVVTGLIKANFPARICFGVASSIDSRVVLDECGAELLREPGSAIYSRGQEKIKFTSLQWSDDMIRDAISFASARKRRLDKAITELREEETKEKEMALGVNTELPMIIHP